MVLTPSKDEENYSRQSGSWVISLIKQLDNAQTRVSKTSSCHRNNTVAYQFIVLISGRHTASSQVILLDNQHVQIIRKHNLRLPLRTPIITCAMSSARIVT